MNIFELKTRDVSETEKCGADLAKKITENPALPRFVALYGDLGVGKTAFVRGFTHAISPSSAVKSPTYTLVNEYRASPLSVFHFDMYRIEDEDSLYSIGFYDYLDRAGICLTEWTENIEFALPDSYIKVTINKTDSDDANERFILAEYIGEEVVKV